MQTSVYVYQQPEDDAAVVRKYARESSVYGLYTPFSAEGGAVRIETDRTVRIEIKELIEQTNFAKARFLLYRTEVFFDDELHFDNTESVRIVIKYTKDNAGIGESRQPSIRAIIAAIRKSEVKSGWARLTEISYQGFGRFQAVVEISKNNTR